MAELKKELEDTTPENNEENNQDLQDNAESDSNEVTLEQVYQLLQDSNGRIDNLEKQLSELSPVAEESTEESTEESPEESTEESPEESTEESESDESVESNEEKEISEDELKAVDALLQNK